MRDTFISSPGDTAGVVFFFRSGSSFFPFSSYTHAQRSAVTPLHTHQRSAAKSPAKRKIKLQNVAEIFRHTFCVVVPSQPVCGIQ